MQELVWLVNICFTILMVGLFVWDFRSFGEPTHKDFKAIIMSTGVLGTFVGIFIGLIGFDTLALQDSVPLLLNGLKTAFYTSILGMGLAIALSITQRVKGIKSAQDMNMDYVVTQIGQLDHLRGILELNNKIVNLPTLEDTRTLNNETNALLQDINSSLQATIKQLASGASRELISALELVIRDFNHNLQNQFGENFKELNSAVGKLLTWQEQYKQNIEHTQELLTQTHKAMSDSANAMNSTQNTLESIVAQNANAMAFYTKSIEVMEDMRSRGEMLNAKLQEIATLGAHAQHCLDSMDKFFITATQQMGELENTTNKHIDLLKNQVESYFAELDSHGKGQMEHLGTFIAQSTDSAREHIGTILESNATGFNSHCNNLVERSSGYFDEITNSASAHIIALGKMLEQNIAQNTQSSNENAQEFARLREHIAKNHNAIVESLESSLSYLTSHNEVIMQDMAKDMKAMQEQYLTLAQSNMESMLTKEQEMTRARLEALSELSAKSDEYVNAQYEQVSGFVKKLASEYLKIIQKLTKDSVAIPKDMGAQVIKDFGTLQHNLLSHLGNLNAQIQHNSMQLIELYRNVQNTINENIEGNKHLQNEIKDTFSTLDTQMSASMENFKENYEWFLRRVREIIGSR